ncbi:MAG TPA: glycosyltransferase family A protein [Kofleriaceae bacterium]|nr:glycosyltransferase family A protein [Kofleriaceae bacterium]
MVGRISVVIPYYNRARFIDDCLASVFDQRRAADEIIVVDDGSRPDERRHLDRFLPRIRIVDQPRNMGVSAARNAGVREATGDWLAFNDSDDRWVPDKLAIQVEHLTRHPACDGVHSAIRAFYDDGHTSVSDPIAPRLTLQDALHDNMIRIQSLMIRSSVMRAIGGFDARLRCCEDDDLGIRLAAGGYQLDYLTEPLTEMRRGNYDHLFSNWRRIIRGKAEVAIRHRALLEQTLGRGATRRRIARAVRKAGDMRGGVVGRVLFAGGWLAGGFDRATD